MKLMIFGIDGGTERILRAFDMPYMHSLMDKSTSIETVDEDLFSRGWSEMVTGHHAVDTRGFYMGPLLDGTHGFSIAYKTDEAAAIGIAPIWSIAEEANASVGVMNIPTTSPAKPVNGFMVGSGGGGINKITGIPESLVYPPEEKETLESLGYIVDIRLTTSGATKIEELFERLIEKENRRTDAFINLAQKHNVDFGFLVDRATTIVQYLCMSEIENRISKSHAADSLVQNLLSDFYRCLDENVRRLIEELKPDNTILTADHSTVPYRYKGNMTPFLEEHGYLRPRSNFSIANVLKRTARQLIGSKKLQSMRKAIPKQAVEMSHSTNWQKTRAFGHDYIDGIYINDERFGGPVKESELAELVDEICEKFNQNEVAHEHDVTAEPYRRKFEGRRYADHLPDIILNKSDELHVVGQGEFLRLNPNYGDIPQLSEVKEDMFSGQKGSRPLLMISPQLAEKIQTQDKMDLTLVYKLTERLFAHS